MQIIEAEPSVFELTFQPRKLHPHLVIALNRMNKRRDALLANRTKLNKEIEELDAAILALK